MNFQILIASVVMLFLNGFPAQIHGLEIELPDPLVLDSGKPVENPEDWQLCKSEMRAQLLKIEYGHAPPWPEVEVVEQSSNDIYLKDAAIWATRTTVKLRFKDVSVQAGYWKARDHEGALPVLLANEPVWWPIPFEEYNIAERVVSRGYIFAGFWNDDFASFEDPEHKPAAVAYPEYDWGTCAVAAWAYSVTMNWLETLPEVDKERVAIWGHSRRGKACALAGALDERFAAVIPHMSGMGGTALYRVRGKGAQELEQLKEAWWLHPSIYEYINREDDLPFDQHWLHALIAPRALYIHVGKKDYWGNPNGELAAYHAATEIYEWLGAADKLGIYVGDYGHHDPNGPEGGDSWETALEFLDLQFRGKKPEREFITLPEKFRHHIDEPKSSRTSER